MWITCPRLLRSFYNMQVLIFCALGLQMPINAPNIGGCFGNTPPIWRAVSMRPPKSTMCRNTYIDRKCTEQPPKIAALMEPHLTHGSFGPPESASQTSSRSVQLFCRAQGCDKQTDQQTGHTTPSVQQQEAIASVQEELWTDSNGKN